MRIGITCYPVPGGSGVVATELGIELKKRGHQVHFISYSLPFRLQKYEEDLFFHEVEVSNYPLFKYPPYTLSLASKMAEVASLWKLDILHVHYAIPHATCAFLAKQIIPSPAPKIITTLHGTDITLVGNDKSFFEITKFSIAQSDGITAVSSYLSERTKREFGIEKDIEVIPNFVDCKRFKPGDFSCKKQFASADEKVLMHISNFRPVKRIGDVIKVFDLIQKEIPAVLLLIGEGPDLPLAIELTNNLNLKDKVIFLGSQDFVENLLPVADLFLLPSQNESFGLVALEALSCGVPVIATNTGGLPEVVENEKCGYLANLGDVEFMAEKGIELLKDENKLGKFKECARKTALEKFDSQIIVPWYENFYKKILEK